LVYDPNTRSLLPLSEILAIEQRVLDASNQPTKKKKRISPKQNTGAHLVDGTIGGRARGSAVDEMEAAKQVAKLTAEAQVRDQPLAGAPVPTSAVAVPPIRQTTAPATKAIKTTTSGLVSDSDSESYIPNSSDNESEVSSPPSKFNTRAGGLLAKRPSIVREDKEREKEEEEEATAPRLAVAQGGLKVDTTSRTISPSPLPRSTQDNGYSRGQAPASTTTTQVRQQLQRTSHPAPVPTVLDAASTTSGDVGHGMEGPALENRVHSVSPVRAPRFAQVPDHLAVKHSPPPRSISPRKSALKQSSSDSPRGQSPAGGVYFGHGSNASETSAGSAGESEEQSLPRKKAVRVSFDENNVVVGRGAGQDTFASSVTESPLDEFPSKRNWLNLTGRGKKKEAIIAMDNDEVMQPRPALPSFGSIRERKQIREIVEERPLVKPSDVVDDAGLAAEPNEHPLGQSNDHIVGAIIAQDAALRNGANISRSREPLPPQVTSVEGSGYNSDEESTVGGDSVDQLEDENITAIPAIPNSNTQQAGKVLASIADKDIVQNGTRSEQVPKIAISEASPPLDETSGREQWPDVPGGWSEGNNSDSESPTQRESPTSEHRAVNSTPATVGIAEPLPREAEQGSPVLGHIAAENLHEHPTIMEETEESDATSIYSDAAEELSDVEGGFISLDAVVESPVSGSKAMGVATGAFSERPMPRTAEIGIPQCQQAMQSQESAIDDSWEKAQSYWGSLSAEKKLQLEQEAREEAEASDSTIEAPKPTPKPKKKTKPAHQQAPVTVPAAPQPVMNERTYMITPGSKASADHYIPVMRSSMRAAPLLSPSETHMRMSLRSQGAMRSSMREQPQMAQQRGSLVKKNRPVSLPSSNIVPDPAAVNTHIRALSAVAAARDSARVSQAPALQRRGSGDSESSFRRTRAGESSTFRRSMRNSMDNPSGRQQSPTQSSRFSLRSLSPTGSGVGRLPFSNAAHSTTTNNSMRTSLRNPMPTKSSKLLPSFGRSSSQLSKGKTPAQRSSRFADSSDEEDEARPAFRSRFVDSSDDEAPTPSGANGGLGRGTMRTSQDVRRIPRPPGVEDGDSSDLPDSDDEMIPSPVGLRIPKKQNGTAAAVSNQGTALGTSTLRRSGSGRHASGSLSIGAFPSSPTRSRGANFMSILRRKKADPSSKVRKAEVESAARRDTPLERSRLDLQAVKRNDSYNCTGSGNVKLQKRNTVASWPLAPPGPGTVELESGDGRPHTADAGGGVVGGELSNVVNAVNVEPATEATPELGPRRVTSESLPTELGVNGVGKGRKKKFGMLRKMLRLDE
jgi:serine/arginine repetitive matrix protein 2